MKIFNNNYVDEGSNSRLASQAFKTNRCTQKNGVGETVFLDMKRQK